MHIADMCHGMLGANGIVGAAVNIGTGAAFAAKYRGEKKVSRLVLRRRLHQPGHLPRGPQPRRHLGAARPSTSCENNHYGVANPQSDHTKLKNLADRAAAYGFPGVVVDGNDVLAVREVAAEAVDRARSGGGPTLVEAQDLAPLGPLHRRQRQVPRPGRARGLAQARPHPRVRRGARRRADAATEAELDDIQAEADAEMDAAVEFGKASPFPDMSELTTDVYVGDPAARRERPGMRTLNYMQAIAEALTLEMRRDPNIYIAGEDVGKFGGCVRRHRAGLQGVRARPGARHAHLRDRHHRHAVGAAAAGLRPVVEILFIDFLPIAGDELFNQAAKIHYMFGGQVTCPMVVRTAIGAGIGAAAHHSQSLEALVCHIPGLDHHRPGHPGRRQGPAHRRHPRRQPGGVPGAQDALRLQGRGAGGRLPHPHREGGREAEGTDVTLVCYSAMVRQCLAAAEDLAAGWHQRRGARPADAHPPGQGGHPGFGRQDRPGWSSCTRPASPAASAARSRRSSPTRASDR